jgi:hypothetical protein
LLDQDVGRLDVAVDQAMPVSGMNGLRHDLHHLDFLDQGHVGSGDIQGLSLDVLHGDAGLAFPFPGFEHFADIRVFDLSLVLGFQHETLNQLRIVPAKKFKGHRPFQPWIVGLENAPQAAFRDELEVPVARPGGHGKQFTDLPSFFRGCLRWRWNILPKPRSFERWSQAGLQTQRMPGDVLIAVPPARRGFGDGFQHRNIGLVKHPLDHQGCQEITAFFSSSRPQGLGTHQAALHRQTYDASLPSPVQCPSTSMDFL